MDDPKVITGDAEELASNTEPALVFMEISRAAIEEENIGTILARLHVLTDTAESTRLYRESLVLYVSGYDEDSRELCEIPAVRSFFQRLVEEWPHFLWFLNRDTEWVGTLMTLLCAVRITRKQGGFFTEFVEPSEAKRKMLDLFTRGNVLFATYKITKEEADESAKSAAAVIFGNG